MATLEPNELLVTTFEPKQQNRFILKMDGIDAYIIKGVSAVTLTQDEIVLNYINLYQKVKGKTKWSNITLTLFDPITPSGAQSVIEWVRLHHESVTGRNGYQDMYKKELVLQILGPVGDIVSEWAIKGAFIVNSNFGEYSWDNESTAQNLTIEVTMDYCVLNF
jgi:hypothetical protein